MKLHKLKLDTKADFDKSDILRADYSERFDQIRKNMVVTSHYKYGAARDNFNSGRVDALATAERCIEAFKKDRNLEHLCDAANYLMFRFKYPIDGDECC